MTKARAAGWMVGLSVALGCAVAACGSEGAGNGDPSGGGSARADAGGEGGTSGGGGGAACAGPGDFPMRWARVLTTEGGSLAGFAVAPDGGFRLVGSFGNVSVPFTFAEGEPGETTLVPDAKTADAWVASFGPEGDLAWAQRAGGTGRDDATAVAVGADGATFVVGTFEGTATFGKGRPGEATIVASAAKALFVARYEASGALAWVKQAGGAGTGTPYRLAVLADGSVVVSGGLVGSVTFGAGEPAQAMVTAGTTYLDAFVARYTASGALGWVKRVKAIRGTARVSPLADGALVIAPATPETAFAVGEPNETLVTDADVAIARYRLDGTVASVATASGAAPTDVAVTPDGGFTVVGTLFAEGAPRTVVFAKGAPNETTFSGTKPTYFHAHYGPDAKLSWVKQGTDAGDTMARAIGRAPDGSFRVLGTTGASSGPLLGAGEPGAVRLPSSPCAGSECAVPFLASYRPDGTVLAARRQASVPARAIGLGVAPDGSTLVAGVLVAPTTFGEGAPGSVTLPKGGLYAARFGACP